MGASISRQCLQESVRVAIGAGACVKAGHAMEAMAQGSLLDFKWADSPAIRPFGMRRNPLALSPLSKAYHRWNTALLLCDSEEEKHTHTKAALKLAWLASNSGVPRCAYYVGGRALAELFLAWWPDPVQPSPRARLLVDWFRLLIFQKILN